jgi:hypothetical protein
MAEPAITMPPPAPKPKKTVSKKADALEEFSPAQLKLMAQTVQQQMHLAQLEKEAADLRKELGTNKLAKLLSKEETKKKPTTPKKPHATTETTPGTPPSVPKPKAQKPKKPKEIVEGNVHADLKPKPAKKPKQKKAEGEKTRIITADEFSHMFNPEDR